jgi:hypothetical protein
MAVMALKPGESDGNAGFSAISLLLFQPVFLFKCQ